MKKLATILAGASLLIAMPVAAKTATAPGHMKPSPATARQRGISPRAVPTKPQVKKAKNDARQDAKKASKKNGNKPTTPAPVAKPTTPVTPNTTH